MTQRTGDIGVQVPLGIGYLPGVVARRWVEGNGVGHRRIDPERGQERAQRPSRIGDQVFVPQPMKPGFVGVALRPLGRPGVHEPDDERVVRHWLARLRVDGRALRVVDRARVSLYEDDL